MARHWGHWGHPDHDAPEFHLSDRPVGPAPKRLSKDELRRLDEALRQIERAMRGAKEA